MKKSILLILTAFLITGCQPDHEKTFAWAEKFCGGKDKISSFYTYHYGDVVYCVDGRRTDIPVL